MERNRLGLTFLGYRSAGKGWLVRSGFFFLFIVSQSNALASPTDSLRLERINGKQFIIHQVDPKETLYSISRRYGVTVALIVENNPKSDGGLSVGQELKIPYSPKAKPEKEITTHKVVAKETLFSIAKQYQLTVDDLKKWNNLKGNALDVGMELIIKQPVKITEPVKVQEPVKMPETKSLKGAHTVTAKETLYSVAKMYGATVQQLKTWNNLTSDEVKPGQILFVLPPMNSETTTTTVTTTTEVKPAVEVVKPAVEESKPAAEVIKPAATEIKISENVVGSDEIHETGSATLIEGTDGNRKYLAQHKTAKVGTIMKVRSEATKREVFVRVIGPLTVDDGSLIKISKSACDRIGATDARFNVELIYYK
jgi:LysM repeat protein